MPGTGPGRLPGFTAYWRAREEEERREEEARRRDAEKRVASDLRHRFNRMPDRVTVHPEQ